MKKLLIAMLLLCSVANAQSLLMYPDDDESYLLDDYSGATAAYSLRQLSSTYTGAAIRVRRSSDSLETDIGFIGGILNQDALTSFVGAGDGFVTTWYDQSGNANDATQTTPSKQAMIVNSGSVILDDAQPSILFDGIDDDFTFTNAAISENWLMSVWVNSTNASTVREGLVATNGNNLVFSTWSSARYRLASYDGAVSTVASFTPASQTVRQLITACRMDGAIKLYQDVTLKDSQTCNTATGTAGTWKIGGQIDAWFDGKMSDCIIYNSECSAELLQAIYDRG